MIIESLGLCYHLHCFKVRVGEYHHEGTGTNQKHAWLLNVMLTGALLKSLALPSTLTAWYLQISMRQSYLQAFSTQLQDNFINFRAKK